MVIGMFNKINSKNKFLKFKTNLPILLIALFAVTETKAAQDFFGPKRWGIDDETIEFIARVAANETGYKQGKFESKYASQDLAEFASKWKLVEANVRDFTFQSFKNRSSYKAPQLYCIYQEPLEPFAEAGVDLVENAGTIKKVEIVFWPQGTRAALDSGMYQPSGWDGHADTQVGECPNDLASAMEIGFGVNVWEQKRPQFKRAVEERVRFLRR